MQKGGAKERITASRRAWEFESQQQQDMFFDDRLSAMERFDNNSFDSKMRAFYSAQKTTGSSSSSYQQRTNSYPLSTDPEKLVGLIEDHCVDAMALRQAHDSSRRRINELESELVELRAKKQAEAFIFPTGSATGNNPFSSPISAKTFGNGSSPLTATNMVHLEENRRHERQAALAIAEHDAVLIRKMEGELVSLRSQHGNDVRLVKDCAERVTNLLRDNEEKDRRISISDMAVQRLQSQLNTLTDQLRTAELLLQHEKSSNLSRMDSRKDEAMDRLLREDTSASHSFEKYLTNPNESESMARVRAENVRLRAALSYESQRLREQEDAFTRVKVSAEEITLLEAEEIARLETELDKCLDDKEHWQKRAKVAELELLHTQQKFQEYVKHEMTQGELTYARTEERGAVQSPGRNKHSGAMGLSTNLDDEASLDDASYPGTTYSPSYSRHPMSYDETRNGDWEYKRSSDFPSLAEVSERVQDFESRLKRPIFEEEV